MALYEMVGATAVREPSLIAAFDGWIDAGSAATTAAAHLGEGGETVATFDADVLYDYRARRPSLEIVDGRMAELVWPDLSLQRVRFGSRDALILSGHEPDFHWHELTAAIVEIAKGLEVVEWISLGAIPAAVPHTRAVPVLGSASRDGLLRGGVRAGPEGVLRVPAAAISVLEMGVAAAGIPALGYYTQIPHYLSGPYPAAAVELLRAVERHLDGPVALQPLVNEASELRVRLDAAAAADDATKAHVERLEAMVDEERQPSGDDLIADIERFLREQGPPTSGGRPN
ncbi:MAG TPA: PAC2 family protein [Candidatus Limnocylindrales bacterium]|nr:PAC2 family protein [Candidatus Limnocylindrales bacterium]